MKVHTFIALVASLFLVSEAVLPRRKHSTFAHNYTLPPGFMMGVATASYQIEGGWNEDGKGVNIWDTLTHSRSDIVDDHSNGNIACDSYHQYKKDVQLLKYLGVEFYRFSISWSRILPTGYANQINQAGINYYNALIDELLANGIQPMVTIFHWDFPQPLQDIGGWPNGVLANYFEDYAKVLFTYFGDRVKIWITFNEPQSFVSGYANNRGYAPALDQHGIADYLAAHTVLHAHARVYHLYYKEFKKIQQGRVGITLNINWCEPISNSTEDIASCERYQQFNFGLYAHPIFSITGDYPKVLKERVARMSAMEGYPSSRLPTFTRREVLWIRGTSDFLGLNLYTAFLGKNGEQGKLPSMERDMGVVISQDTSWPSSASSWLKVVPWGFRKQLNWIRKAYNNPVVIVTENGYSDHGQLNDTSRANYYVCYLKEMLKAIYEDGCNVMGYTAWSLLDNFEWNRGYTEKFGLFQVDFKDPARTRRPKLSAGVLAEIIKNRIIPDKLVKNIQCAGS